MGEGKCKCVTCQYSHIESCYLVCELYGVIDKDIVRCNKYEWEEE